MTRAEKIRQMTDQELSAMLCDLIWESAGCGHCRFSTAIGCRVKDWIASEAKDEVTEWKITNK